MTWLFLSVNSDVIAIQVVGDLLVSRRLELKSDAALKLRLECFWRPTVLQEKEFQTGSLAIFTKYITIPEYLGDTFQNRNDLLLLDERVEPRREMGVGRKASANAE